ncbi:hypothetical protein [Actinomadura sp. 9N215]|uniref:hypothetical protein n=1 Tax=Actinomadura sp. 9N215 TaxID=3375150 RepID=UPI0037B50EDD
MVTEFRPGPDGQETPEDLLGHACTLVRLCARDSVIAAVFLALVLAGALSRLAAGLPGPVALALLPVLAVAFAVSASYAVRSRLTMVSALAEIRVRTGAPVEPRVPWTPFGSAVALDDGVRDEQLRRLLSAAHRCGELSWQAVVWAVTTSVLFLFWTLAAAMAGG